MCTAATYRSQDFYFGRTFDYEFNYGEEVVVTPRNYSFQLRHQNALTEHYAMIGIAHMVGDYPLYYDAVNEKGLGMAGLNFAGNAVYRKPKEGRDNIAQFEFIPWILGQCATVQEARTLLAHINLVDTRFSEQFPTSQLHWILADRDEAITIEAVEEGLNIYDNPVGVLTNNPPFDKQLFRLNDYSYLSPDQPVNRFSEQLQLQPYSRGMGAMGLPGDLSSASRFVRVAFTKMNSVSGTSESESVSQFFHILGSVAQTRGCCRLETVSMRSPFILPAVMQTGGFIITLPMRTTRSQPWICTGRTWMGRSLCIIPWCRESISYCRMRQIQRRKICKWM